MKKAFDQTVRDLKREVNKKVLKVPSIEQKVLDATSNEPWGPHGSHLADIAQATRNYHEYQMIMSVIWRRINDTGKNWRHVYKALTILEYLVAHGSERVIDDIREHAYQISTLSDFQYIDSSGRDQGSNVRKKSQSLVVLANDKERIQEVRQKAAANRDKYRSTSVGGMYRPSAGGYGDRNDDDRYEGRYGSRDEDRNGNGREREWGYGDDDRNGRYGDSYGRDGDRYGRDYEDHYGKDDSNRGRSQSVDDYNYGSRSRSSDRYRDRAYEDDGQYSSSRGNGARADDRSQDESVTGRRLDRKYSEQNLGAPPSYEEAVGEARSPVHSERDGEAPASAIPKSSPPPLSNNNKATTTSGMPSTAAPVPVPAPAPTTATASATPAAPGQPPTPAIKKVESFDEFDPRSSFSAAPNTSNAAEMDLLGSLSDSFALALVPATIATTAFETDVSVSSGQAFAAAPSAFTASNQPFEDPFGDGPFRATSTEGFPAQPQNVTSTSSFKPGTNQGGEPPQTTEQKVETVNFGFGDPGIKYSPSSTSNVQPPSTSSQYSHQEMSSLDQNADILADILPPSGPSPPTASQPAFQAQSGQLALQTGFPAQSGFPPQTSFRSQSGQPASLTGFPGQHGQQTAFPVQMGQPPSLTGFPAQAGQPASVTSFPSQVGQPTGFPSQISHPETGFSAPVGQNAQPTSSYYGGFHAPSGFTASGVSPIAPQASTGSGPQHNVPNFLSQSQVQPGAHIAQQPTSTTSLAIVPQPAKDKFETKSTVWADTLNRGLVNLNISGSKTNPLANIGVDFDAINRKEKRMEKPSTAPVISNVSMGKAMGSGSGIGRAGAGALRAPSTPVMGSGMGMGMAGGPGASMGMGGYVGVNQPMGVGMGMGMGMNVPGNMGAGMNMGRGQGVQMQQPAGFPPAQQPYVYNPMMGSGGYGQQPYGGYR